jgi:hypothetical protein
LLENWMYVKIACEKFHKVAADPAGHGRPQLLVIAII